MMRSGLVASFFIALMILGAGPASGQDYPNKPVRIVTSGIGGGADFIARIVAQGIAGSLGQEVVVVNFPSGLIPGQTVSRAPAGTPGAILSRLNQETVRALNQPDVKRKLLNSGVEAVASLPEELAAKIRSDLVKWGKVIKDAGIQAQ